MIRSGYHAPQLDPSLGMWAMIIVLWPYFVINKWLHKLRIGNEESMKKRWKKAWIRQDMTNKSYSNGGVKKLHYTRNMLSLIERTALLCGLGWGLCCVDLSNPHSRLVAASQVSEVHLTISMNNVDEPILAGCLNRRPTFEPKMVMKETESYLLQNLKSQLWAIGCVKICSPIWVAY
jgi:hypothetical protein